MKNFLKEFQLEKNSANLFMLIAITSVSAVISIHLLIAMVGLPTIIFCSAFILFTASIAVMVEQKQWMMLGLIVFGFCCIIYGIVHQAGLTM